MLSKIIKKGKEAGHEIKEFLCEEALIEETFKPEIVEEKKVESEIVEEKESIEDKKELADLILKEAQKKLEEAEKIYKERYEEGFKKGYEEGKKEALEENKKTINELREKFSQSIKELLEAKNKFIEELSSSTFIIVKEALIKVVASELKLNDEAILNIVKDAISKVSQAKKLTVKLNPQDYSFLEGKVEEVKSSPEQEIKFVPDPSITTGGCVVQTEMGEVDSTVETRIEEVLKAIKE